MKNNIVKYSKKEKENFKNGKVKIAESKKEILEFVKISKQVGNNNKLYLGKINAKLAKKIQKNIGIDLKNYNISLSTNSIKHIFKNHGEIDFENMRGQKFITEEDFTIIPEIISNFDKVTLVGKTENNNQAIQFIKKIKETYYLINYVSDRHYNLEIKTMWKIKK